MRLSGIGSTIFAEMSALAVRTGSVNLGQGFPDEDGPAEVLEAAVEALRGGRNQYPPGHGTPELLDAVIAHQHGTTASPLPDQVVVTTGATEAIAGALLGLVDPGDEVVCEPYYDSYVAMIQIAGGVRRPVTLRAPDFRLDLDELAAAITPRTMLILLNTPHNPTGTVLNRRARGRGDSPGEHDLIVVTDEVYEHLTFEATHVPMATLPGMFERTLTISSSGKTFSVTGWKVGWASGPAELVAAVEGAKNWLTYVSGPRCSPRSPSRYHEDAFHERLRVDSRPARPALRGLAAARHEGLPPGGDLLRDHRRLGVRHRDGREFCLALPELARVVAIPSQVFYDDLGGPAPGALGVLQGARRDRRGHKPAGCGRPPRLSRHRAGRVRGAGRTRPGPPGPRARRWRPRTRSGGAGRPGRRRSPAAERSPALIASSQRAQLLRRQTSTASTQALTVQARTTSVASHSPGRRTSSGRLARCHSGVSRIASSRRSGAATSISTARP